MAHYESLEQRLFADEQSGCGLDGLPKNNELSGFHIDEFLGVDAHAHHAPVQSKMGSSEFEPSPALSTPPAPWACGTPNPPTFCVAMR